LNNLLDRYISWPLNQNIQADIAVKLHEKKGFPGILGCIDEKKKIKAPHEYSQSYANRKSYQCDTPSCLFTSCFVGWPGSCHDSRVLDEELSILGGWSKGLWLISYSWRWSLSYQTLINDTIQRYGQQA
jgi:hypothetical protein